MELGSLPRSVQMSLVREACTYVRKNNLESKYGYLNPTLLYSSKTVNTLAVRPGLTHKYQSFETQMRIQDILRICTLEPLLSDIGLSTAAGLCIELHGKPELILLNSNPCTSWCIVISLDSLFARIPKKQDTLLSANPTSHISWKTILGYSLFLLPAAAVCFFLKSRKI